MKNLINEFKQLTLGQWIAVILAGFFFASLLIFIGCREHPKKLAQNILKKPHIVNSYQVALGR